MSDLVVLLTGGGTGVGLETVKQLLGQTTTTRVSVLTLAVTPELKALEGNFGSGRLLIVEGDATVVSRF
jgi:NAD(P)-dependent dehydrogenase (short-subunit alcohol dehydrogenase family)